MITAALLVKHFGLTLFSSVPKELHGVMAVRAVVGTITFLCFVVAIVYIPVAVFFIITGSSVLTTALMQCCCLQDKVSLFEIFCMLIAVTGILMIGMSGDDSKHTAENEVYESKHNYKLGIIIASLVTFGFSIASVTSRMLQSVNFAVV